MNAVRLLYLGSNIILTLSHPHILTIHLHAPTDALLSVLYSGPLHGIMRGLIENIMKAPAGMQRVRAYLYGALLYYLLLTKQEEGEDRRKGVETVCVCVCVCVLSKPFLPPAYCTSFLSPLLFLPPSGSPSLFLSHIPLLPPFLLLRFLPSCFASVSTESASYQVTSM